MLKLIFFKIVFWTNLDVRFVFIFSIQNVFVFITYVTYAKITIPVKG